MTDLVDLKNMNSSVHFSIRYDGPALSNHQMDVRELAPALIADLRIIQTVTDEGLRQAYYVEHVHEHRAPLQWALG